MKRDEILLKLKELKLINKTHTMDSRIFVSDAVNIIDYFLKTHPTLLGENKVETPITPPKSEVVYTTRGNFGYVSVNPLDVSVFVQNANIFNCNARNALNGTFFWAGKPGGILIQDGKILYGSSSHAWRGYPQAVLYCDIEGKVGITVIKSANEFPHVERVKWAIGGFSLINPSGSTPAKEGFNAQFADVLRTTYKTSIGYNASSNKIIMGVHLLQATYNEQVANMQSLGCKYAIGLDGGGSSTIKVNGSVKLSTYRTLNNFVTWK